MNKRKLISGLSLSSRAVFPAFAVCSGLFVLGVVSGAFLSAGFCDSGGAEAYLTGYLLSLSGGALADVSAIFWGMAKYLLIAFLLGFSVLGVVGIPALSFVRGFSIAFVLSVFTRMYSLNGALMGMILFGVVSAVSAPVFILVAAGGMSSSLALGRVWFLVSPAPGLDTRAYFLRFLAALLLVLLLALGQRAILGSGLLDLPIFS